MSWKSVRNWMVREEDANDAGIIGVLHSVEAHGVAMIRGIGHFVAVRIPQLLNVSLDWLRKVGHVVARIGVRLLRVAAVITFWLIIVFGPLTVAPGVITGGLTVLGLTGSAWGLRRFHRQRFVVKTGTAVSSAKASTADPRRTNSTNLNNAFDAR
jgi:hypothetical protein